MSPHHQLITTIPAPVINQHHLRRPVQLPHHPRNRPTSTPNDSSSLKIGITIEYVTVSNWFSLRIPYRGFWPQTGNFTLSVTVTG